MKKNKKMIVGFLAPAVIIFLVVFLYPIIRTIMLMRASLGETDSRDYLLSAQSKGEISMIEYLVETDQYYEALEQTLSAERDYHQALARLNAVEL